MNIANTMVHTGLSNVGYKYINLDCGWTTGFRDGVGVLVTNTTVFPHGMQWLGNQLHDMGLKFGIYADAGRTQCCSRFYKGANDGSYLHEEGDAKLFAQFGVDYLKYDDCGSVKQSYTDMRDALNKTGRPIYYSIHGPSGASAVNLSNCWRTTSDVSNTYSSMLQRAVLNDGFASNAGPGAFNDPDMLEVGNFFEYGKNMENSENLNLAASRTNFALWCAMKAPLLIGTDLTIASKDILEILGNKLAIAINQDKLGMQARLVNRTKQDRENIAAALNGQPQGSLTWVGPLEQGNKALVVINTNNQRAANITVNLKAILLWTLSQIPDSDHVQKYQLEDHIFSATDVWTGHGLGEVSGNLTLTVGPSDAVFWRLSPIK
jgi:alpha-galactosidase